MSEYWLRVEKIQQNEEQKRVLAEDISRVVIAGPGSGKTYLLTTKVAKLLHTNAVVYPHRIACLTYSNFLANQLREDLQALEILDDERLFVGTVHSFCIAEIIVPFQKLYNLPVPIPLRIASEDQQTEAIKYGLTQQNTPFADQRNPSIKDIARTLGNYRRLHWDDGSVQFPKAPAAIQARYPNLNWQQLAEDYVNFLLNAEQPAVDFAHLEVVAVRTVRSHPLVQQSLAARFKWWVVDEYQDLGRPFHQMMLCLLQNTPAQLLAIGDPDQCIYEELQAAKPELIRELSERIIERGEGEMVHLKTNYRSTQQIINLAELVLDNDRGYVSSFTPSKQSIEVHYRQRSGLHHDNLRHLLQDLTQNKGVTLNQIAILHRKRDPLTQISYMLDGRNWANMLDKDPEYNVRSRPVEWIQYLARWCTKESMSQRPYFIDLLPMWLTLVEDQQDSFQLNERFNHEKRLFETLWKLRQMQVVQLKAWFIELSERLQLNQLVEAYRHGYPDDVQEFDRLAWAIRDGRRLSNWDVAKFAQSGERIQLTTIHSSKGAQFEAVIIMGGDEVNWNNPPSDLDRRLAYVGITRARRYLFLLHSNQDAYFVRRIRNAPLNVTENVTFYDSAR